MALETFSPSAEFKNFSDTHGEDTYINLNLLYIAFEMNDIYTEESGQSGEFDELCRDVLEMYLDDQFDSFNLVDVADGVAFIMQDSNYSVSEYTRTYRKNREKLCEELLAYLQKERRTSVQND